LNNLTALYFLVIISHKNIKKYSERILNYNGAVEIMKQVFIHTRIRIYKTLARSMLAYSSEAWTVYKR